jgi:hypothetical protein
LVALLSAAPPLLLVVRVVAISSPPRPLGAAGSP